MEMTLPRQGRRNGWSEQEDRLLWETASEAQKMNTPLKKVFDEIALKTGRRPNSIRNYYYAQAQKRGEGERAQRFVPFAEDEVVSLLDRVLRAKAQGRSVRSCLTEMAGGDHRLMLRYQNKYRSILRSHPELVKKQVDALSRQGVTVRLTPVEEKPAAPEEAVNRLRAAAQESRDADVAAMCDTLTRLIRASGKSVPGDRLAVRLDLMRIAADEKEARLRRVCQAGEALVREMKEWIMLPDQARRDSAEKTAETFKELLGPLEESLTENAPKIEE